MSTLNQTRTIGNGQTNQSSSRLTRWVATTVMVLGLAALVIPFGTMAARAPSYSPSLAVTFSSSLAAARTSSDSTAYVISGCGYDVSFGNVTVVVNSPEATSWTGRTPDANGCISVENFSTQGAGSYRIQAWQHVRNKDVVVASTSFTL
jgi:hypothetical protein